MKYLYKFSVFAALAASAILLYGCGGGGGGGAAAETSDDGLREYLESAEMRSDLDNLAEFAYLAEYLKAAPIAFMAGEDGLFTDEVDSSEAAEYFSVMSLMAEKLDQYEAAWARIDSMQALVTETPTSLQKNEVGLFYSFYEFCSSLGSAGKESREKSMAVIARLSDQDRKDLFDGLSRNLQKGETDYKTWWRNFNSGEYDKAALQIYNNFVHNEYSDFGAEAETITQVVATKGKEMTEKGVAFQTEVLKTVMPDPVTDAMEDFDTADKIHTIVTKGKDMSPSELSENVMNLMVDGYEDANKVAKMTTGYVEDNSTNADNYREKDASMITFENAGKPTEGGMMAIAVASSGKVTIALGANEDGKGQIIVKEEGPHLVSFLTGLGEKFTKKLDVAAGEFYKLVGEMNEKAIRDSLAAKSSTSRKSSKISSSSKEELSSSSVEEESSSSMEVSKDVKSIYGRWVAAKDVFIYKVTDEAQCQELKNAMSEIYDGVYDGLYQGLGEYASMMTEDCENKEVPQNTVSGQKILFYSDGTLDCLDGSGDLLGSYDYTFDESTGIFSYESSEGEMSTGQVSADGTTLVFETVTDMGYKTITHRVIFEKESGDIE